MLKIGLTGGIGSGKSAVSDQFKKLGINIIDTDVISHRLLNHNPVILNEIVNIFTDNILDHSGVIDRRKLAKRVFGHTALKQQLENILHPAIQQDVKDTINRFSSQTEQPEYLIIVIPLLLETDFTALIDRTLVILANEDLRIERIKQRDKRSAKEIKAIFEHQASDEERILAADDIIENNSNINRLESQVLQLHEKYRKMSTQYL